VFSLTDQAALAERSWHRASWELDYKAGVKFDETTTNVDKKALDADLNQFVNVLAQRELAKIDALGVKVQCANGLLRICPGRPADWMQPLLARGQP
jgi:N-acetyl-beta-hexosaminidase